MTEQIDFLALKIWDYHHMNHTLQKADCILVLGSHDTRVAERGAQLFLESWAPLIVFSGGLGNFTKDVWDEPEADKFAKIAITKGVPRGNILIENQSTNTGENFAFTKRLLLEYKMNIKRVIAVQKPYMERRTYATAKKVWPELDIIVSSPQISFQDYPTGDISKEDVIHIMLGDLQRIKLYPEKGFQIHQDIPKDIWDVYNHLVKLGYTRHLISM